MRTTSRIGQLATVLLLAAATAAMPALANADPAGSRSALPPLCPAAYPLGEIRVNSNATGWTVVQGSTPVKFKVKVLGVLNDQPSAGHQLVMVRIDPTWKPIREAHGIWQGMSGSPVYAADGRLLGAISFVLADSGSEYGGLTPASEMLPLLDLPPAPPPSAQNPGKAVASGPRALSADQKATLAKAGVPQTLLAAGIKPLQNPYYASGVSASRLPALRKELARHNFTNPVYAAPAGPAAAANAAPAGGTAQGPGDAGQPVLEPGDNYGTSITTGDVTLWGVGTVTLTCGSKVLAFGHGMTNAGNINQGAHTAVTLNIQPDVVPHKVANIGPQVGRNDQDRPTGVRALIGAAVPYAPLSSNVRMADTGVMRQFVTRVNEPNSMGLATYVQSTTNITRSLHTDAHGSVVFGMGATGTDANGQRLGFTRWDIIADRGDLPATLSQLVGTEIGHRLDAIYLNPFLAMKFDAVSLTMYPTTAYRGATLTRLLILQGATWVPVTEASSLTIPAGSQVSLRAEYQPRSGGAVVVVPLGLKAPTVRGASELSIRSGSGLPPGFVDASGNSLAQIVQGVATKDRRNAVTVTIGSSLPSLPGVPTPPGATTTVTGFVSGLSVLGDLRATVTIV